MVLGSSRDMIKWSRKRGAKSTFWGWIELNTQTSSRGRFTASLSSEHMWRWWPVRLEERLGIGIWGTWNSRMRHSDPGERQWWQTAAMSRWLPAVMLQLAYRGLYILKKINVSTSEDLPNNQEFWRFETQTTWWLWAQIPGISRPIQNNIHPIKWTIFSFVSHPPSPRFLQGPDQLQSLYWQPGPLEGAIKGVRTGQSKRIETMCRDA